MPINVFRKICAHGDEFDITDPLEIIKARILAAEGLILIEGSIGTMTAREIVRFVRLTTRGEVLARNLDISPLFSASSIGIDYD